MIEQFVNFVIRPPRSEYNPDQYLWEKEFILAGRKYKRLDLEASTETIYRAYKCKRLYLKMQPLCSCFYPREYCPPMCGLLPWK
ncbi:alpha/beta-Hydrolases superfamily protein [Zea mays]|uniref:Alpha/beta-Hydrolases superfamily protein n=1 Tax=Zea mays TaxID=4577 RepID=A0A1D6H423_MAIZE|nr:alpha/beta-Hydrolases superfamily protein [Zea mays]